MNWYSGNIAEAVALSKTKHAIFVVYVEGKDELSQKLSGFVNDKRIKSKLESDNFVAIKVEGGSEAYMQFAQIYQLVPLPSIFFIGKNGTPLEVVTGVIPSIEELDQKIEKVLELAGLSKDKGEKSDEVNIAPSTSQTSNTNVALTSTSSNVAAPVSSTSTSENFISNEQKSTESLAQKNSPDIVCDGDVCYRKSESTKSDVKEFKEKSETEQPEKQSPTQELEEVKNIELKGEKQENQQENTKKSIKEKEENKEDKLELAKKLLEEKRREREAEEAKLEREREIQRRKEGQEMQNLKKWQKDQELQQLKEKIQREKQEEQATRQRILEQIAADRAERAQKMNLSTPAQQQKTEKSSPTPSTSRQTLKAEKTEEVARIQFRKQSGEAETHNFLANDQFKIVRDFVRNTLLDGTKVKEFSLATTFPRREFTSEDDTKTLQELDLYPSAVLLVLIPISGPSAVVARSGGVINMFNSIFWGMLSPIFYVFNYIKGLITGRQTRNGSTAQKRPNEESTSSEVSKKRNLSRFENNEFVDDSSMVEKSDGSKDKSLPYKRIGNSNIHRLRDQKDSDDENNTWNGNSTQQQ